MPYGAHRPRPLGPASRFDGPALPGAGPRGSTRRRTAQRASQRAAAGRRRAGASAGAHLQRGCDAGRKQWATRPIWCQAPPKRCLAPLCLKETLATSWRDSDSCANGTADASVSCGLLSRCRACTRRRAAFSRRVRLPAFRAGASDCHEGQRVPMPSCLRPDNPLPTSLSRRDTACWP